MPDTATTQGPAAPNGGAIVHFLSAVHQALDLPAPRRASDRLPYLRLLDQRAISLALASAGSSATRTATLSTTSPKAITFCTRSPTCHQTPTAAARPSYYRRARDLVVHDPGLVPTAPGSLPAPSQPPGHPRRQQGTGPAQLRRVAVAGFPDL